MMALIGTPSATSGDVPVTPGASVRKIPVQLAAQQIVVCNCFLFCNYAYLGYHIYIYVLSIQIYLFSVVVVCHIGSTSVQHTTPLHIILNTLLIIQLNGPPIMLDKLVLAKLPVRYITHIFYNDYALGLVEFLLNNFPSSVCLCTFFRHAVLQSPLLFQKRHVSEHQLVWNHSSANNMPSIWRYY